MKKENGKTVYTFIHSAHCGVAWYLLWLLALAFSPPLTISFSEESSSAGNVESDECELNEDSSVDVWKL